MKVKNARAAELSDFEVLSVLKDLERKQRDMAASTSSLNHIVTLNNRPGVELSVEERAMQSLPPNLRTIQYEVLETLGNVQRPCAHQNAEQIPHFLDALHAWERARPVAGVEGLTEDALRAPIEREKRFTKGERLLLVNHAPTTEIELYSLVEEMEERFTEDQIQDVLAIVAAHLPLDQDVVQQAARMDDAGQIEGGGGGKILLDAQEIDDEGLADPDDDMDMLENEGRGEGTVDDDGPEDE